MAKRHIIPMGKHKPLGSSWKSFDHAYGRGLMPENRPEYQCYITGQQSAMIASYEQHKKAVDMRKAQIQALLVLKEKLLDKGLL